MFFFFSSRRRHTRSKRDWSSDVCSSDLETWDWLTANASQAEGARVIDFGIAHMRRLRSEERRVGKECRSRWWSYHLKKKCNSNSGWMDVNSLEDAIVGHSSMVMLLLSYH